MSGSESQSIAEASNEAFEHSENDNNNAEEVTKITNRLLQRYDLMN